jgi:3-(3-hydroxy-phenyl)propionate hydroxylase
LATALDLGRQGIDVVLLDDHEGVGKGSRAICFAKRTLEITDQNGASAPILDKSVIWNLGKVFYDDRQLSEFKLLPESGHKHPAFINLQQPYFEKFLFEQITAETASGAPIDVRGKNRVDAVRPADDHVALDVMTPDGSYTITADYVVACDGANSPVRAMLELDFDGRVFQDSFLIADIRMTSKSFPTERWFWFDPHFKSGASTLLHKQPDDIWRVDFQIGWDVDRTEELKEHNVRRRLDAMLGADVVYDIVWSSIYTFQCRRMDSFRHGRVLFAGDAAHQVSPFGARGANSGLQDVDNLGWKLGLVLQGKAPDTLLDSYDVERAYSADENILNSTRATDFITPKSATSRLFRNAVLDLAEYHTFARPIVNSGRLSMPCTYDDLPLNGTDALNGGPDRSRVGSPCPDAPLDCGYLLDQLGGDFVLLAINCAVLADITVDGITLRTVSISITAGTQDALTERYLGAAPRAVYLIRPDQHVAAWWDAFDAAAVTRALRTACAKEPADA